MGKYVLIILFLVIYGILGILSPTTALKALNLLKGFLVEMIQILPMVFILTALLSQWIPSSMIQKHLGRNSGIRGIFFSLLLGSISAGPIYAAFPLAVALHKKGASISRIVIIISSWAVIKIPMLIMEFRFLGPRFTLIRYVISVPAIVILGLTMERLPGMTIEPQEEEHISGAHNDITLPGHNCGACGFGSCEDYAEALQGGNAQRSCVFLVKS